ncbi:hypothetical protein JHD50_01895 [Sulfurimonas sp. MAG313]|nr:hypothetical protein [Sulfurimonas sp. MAG313]MDF1880062.1 hypothetical protein [Sulfurimonas sp. MAG313]
MKIFIIERFIVEHSSSGQETTSITDAIEYKAIEVTQEFADSLVVAYEIKLSKAYREEQKGSNIAYRYATLYFFDEAYFKTIQDAYKSIHHMLNTEHESYYEDYYISHQYQ